MRISDWSSDVCSSDLRLQQIEDADDEDERRVLDLADRSIDQPGHADFQRLRQQDMAPRLPFGEAESVRGLGLPDGNRQQAAPDDLGHIGGSEEYERELDARQAVDREIRGHEQRKQDRSEEHTSELKSLMRISYAVFSLTKKNNSHRE